MNKNWNFPKALLFDLDGVLIDSEPLHGQAWKETALLFEQNLTQDQLKLLRGRRRVDCAKELIKWIPREIKIEDLLNLHKPISRRLILSAQAMPGSESLVRRCHKNKILMALVTSSSSESIQIKTSPYEWMNLFSIKVLGDDESLSKGKPDPAPYLLAAKKLNTPPEECWAVEDSLSGVTSAYKAGCCVLFLKDKNDSLTYKEFSERSNFIKEIKHLNEIEQMLNEYHINKVYL